MTDVARIAVVTGASGFVATELVSQLLHKGYTVRATVRSTKNAEKTAHLEAIGKVFAGKLEFHEADLLKEGSFDEVVKGAYYVFHTASPYQLEIEDPENDLVKPAKEGTLNVLKSVAKSKDTVKRVVLTSSFAAMVKLEKGPKSGKLYTDVDWNDEAKADKATGYYFSKAVAEKLAWDFAKEHGIDLVTINPTGVFGPVISQRSDSTSVKQLKGIIENTSSFIAPWVCDLEDVARAHVLAAETPSAKGRYLVTWPSEINPKQAVEVLSKRFPQYKFPSDADSKPTKEFADVSKLENELGMKITPWQTSFIDMATSLISHGVAKPVKA
ncbi:hypothetical protein WJX73_008070 [Symbiochloris irregularis]|uniref:Flavanone 4-reductase n=1 Tax=Symbiochloris irregularis TaxID=706552 RepID=A0AAW1PVM1_9CHLO